MPIKRQRWLAAASCVALACLCVQPVQAEGPTLSTEEITREVRAVDRALGTAGTADIVGIVARANVLAAMVAQCRKMKCPMLETCEQARQLEQDIARLIALLAAQQRYLELANRDVTNHFKNLKNSEILTGQQQVALIQAIAVQDALIKFSDGLAQAATAIDSVQSLAKGDSSRAEKLLAVVKLGVLAVQLAELAKLTEVKVGDAAQVTSSFAGALTKVEAARAALVKAASGAEAAIRAQGIAVTAAAPTAAQALRGSVSGFNGSGAVPAATSSLADAGEIVQQLLSTYAKQQLAEREQRLNDLIAQSSSEQRVGQGFFIVLKQVQARRFATEDALDALRAVRSDLLDCMALADCPPASRVNYASEIPDFSYRLAGGAVRESWGKALVYLLGEIDALRPKLVPVALRDDCKDPPATANALPGTGLNFGFDSTIFCSFGEGNPEFLPLPILPSEEPAASPSGDPAPGGRPPNPPSPTAPPSGDPAPGGQPPSPPSPTAPPSGDPAPVGQPASPPSPTAPPSGKPPEQSSAPVPKELPPCEELRLLREAISREFADSRDPRLSEADRQAALARAQKLEQRLQDAESDCAKKKEYRPGDDQPQEPGREDEEDVEDPEYEAPPSVTMTFKATSEAIKRGSTGAELGGQVIRLFTPSQLAQPLPTPGGARPQEDYAADPLQAVTNTNGDATLVVLPSDLRIRAAGRTGLDNSTNCGPESGALVNSHLRLKADASPGEDGGSCDYTGRLGRPLVIEVDVTPQDSINVIAADPASMAGLLAYESQFGRLVSLDRVGDYTVGTLMLDKDQTEKVTAQLQYSFPLLLIEPNLCRIKEPTAVTEYHACKLGDRMPPAGAIVLTPPDPREELPGTRIAWPTPSPALNEDQKQ